MQPQGSFIGHIGGDDFVFIMDVNLIEAAAKEIIDAFDRIVPTLYEAEDKEGGYIDKQDRQGNIRQFPFVALSIGITSNKQRSFTHYGEVKGVASEMKGKQNTLVETATELTEDNRSLNNSFVGL